MHLKDQFKEKIHHFFFRKQFWSSLLITIKFPISSHRYPLKIYKVISLPVPINSTSTHASQLLDTPDYLAVTSYHQKYATFLTAQLSDYTRNLPYIICSSNIPLTPVTVPNCMNLHTHPFKCTMSKVYVKKKEQVVVNFAFMIYLVSVHYCQKTLFLRQNWQIVKSISKMYIFHIQPIGSTLRIFQ